MVCVFNSTPLEKYENYRLHLSRWGRNEDEGPDLAPTIYNLIDSLLRFLEINRYSRTTERNRSFWWTCCRRSMAGFGGLACASCFPATTPARKKPKPCCAT